MNFLKRLILLNLNIILTTNLIFTVFILSILVSASAMKATPITSIAQISQDAEVNKLWEEVEALLSEKTIEAKQQAIILLEKFLTLLEKSGDQRQQSLVFLRIANIHNDLGEKQLALTYYEKSLAITQSFGDQSLQGNTLTNIELILDLFCNPCVVRILIKKPGFGSNPLAEKVLTKDTKWVL